MLGPAPRSIEAPAEEQLEAQGPLLSTMAPRQAVAQVAVENRSEQVAVILFLVVSRSHFYWSVEPAVLVEVLVEPVAELALEGLAADNNSVVVQLLEDDMKGLVVEGPAYSFGVVGLVELVVVIVAADVAAAFVEPFVDELVVRVWEYALSQFVAPSLVWIIVVGAGPVVGLLEVAAEVVLVVEPTAVGNSALQTDDVAPVHYIVAAADQHKR